MFLSRKSDLGNPWKSLAAAGAVWLLEKSGVSSLLTSRFGELCPFGFGSVCPSVSLETWLLEDSQSSHVGIVLAWLFWKDYLLFKALVCSPGTDGSVAEENRQKPETWMKE